MIESKFGYYFVSIREDQDAAESMGIDTTLYKTIALCLSGAITGLAGAFYTNYMGYIDPKVVFNLHDISIVTIMVVMVGGVATYWGPTIGAIIMVFLAEIIRSNPGLGAAHQTLFGILLIFIIIFLPNGIAGDYRKLIRLFRPKESLVMSLLQIRNVSKHFGGLAALTDVTYDVNKGEILGPDRPERCGEDDPFQCGQWILSTHGRGSLL